MIRRATIEDLDDRLMPIIEEFYGSSKFLKNFNKNHCIGMWKKFIANNLGIIFLLIDKEEIVGFLAALKYPDILTGNLTATEMAWFVKESQRGKGLFLLKEFEKWAKSERCKSIIMVHLMDSMPKKLENIYQRMGYESVEIHHKKEI